MGRYILQHTKIQHNYSWLFCLLLFSLLVQTVVSCTGNGGSAHSGGTTYTGSTTDGVADNASGETGSLSAADLLELSNAGKVSQLVTLFTAEAVATTPVDLPASVLGLPAGASIIIALTVNGTTTTYTAQEINGNFHFDIPSVPSGTAVSVKMDVRDSSGKLLLTGSASKTVSGANDVLAVTLSDKVNVPVTADFTSLFMAYNVYWDISHGTLMYTTPASPGLPFTLGQSVAFIYGYAVTEDFHLVSTKRIDGFTASEDTSLFAELDSDLGSIEGMISFNCYTDESYEYSFAATYASLFSGAMAQVGFSFVDTHFQLTSNPANPDAWYDYTPSMSLTIGNNVRLRYKIKVGDTTSDWLYSPATTLDMHA